jgi:hypothetical protein
MEGDSIEVGHSRSGEGGEVSEMREIGHDGWSSVSADMKAFFDDKSH